MVHRVSACHWLHTQTLVVEEEGTRTIDRLLLRRPIIAECATATQARIPVPRRFWMIEFREASQLNRSEISKVRLQRTEMRWRAYIRVLEVERDTLAGRSSPPRIDHLHTGFPPAQVKQQSTTSYQQSRWCIEQELRRVLHRRTGPMNTTVQLRRSWNWISSTPGGSCFLSTSASLSSRFAMNSV